MCGVIRAGHSRESGNPARERRALDEAVHAECRHPAAGCEPRTVDTRNTVTLPMDLREACRRARIYPRRQSQRATTIFRNVTFAECDSSMFQPLFMHRQRRWVAPSVGQGFIPAMTQMRDDYYREYRERLYPRTLLQNSNNRRSHFGLGGADKSAPYDTRPTIRLQRDGVEWINGPWITAEGGMTTLFVYNVVCASLQITAARMAL